ncbi:MAG: D-alanyl-D-alanine carboxypeptidase [Oscillospiraceae bacterium]|nr:D-alanyl-D-alanine carboxypeptidase [Oscillospiraceae bacterium]
MKKCLIGALLSMLLFQHNALADSSRSSILIDGETGRVLYENNAHEPLPMASTTKVMTALLALENCDMDEVVTASKNAFGVPGTSIYLSEGEELTMEQMLYGLMLSSGNDAAVAIAEHVAGSVDAFCNMMTRRAEELGCENTVFMTPHGLPHDVHHTTAYDLSLIAREAMKNETFRKIVGTAKMQIPWENHDYARVLSNKNRLLTTYDGSTGIKTGYTNKAGRCLVFSAMRNGMELIGCVLNCQDWFGQAESILDMGFEKYERVVLHQAGERVTEVEIIGGTVDRISVCAAADAAVPMEKGILPRVEMEMPETLEAGIMQGQRVGMMHLYDGNEKLLSVPLLAMEEAPKGTFPFHVRQVVENWLSATP